MSRKNKRSSTPHNCENCENCQYIGEGDYACAAPDENGEVYIIKEDHIPNENYFRCGGKQWERQEW